MIVVINPLEIALGAAERLERSILERRGSLQTITHIGEGAELRHLPVPLVGVYDSIFGVDVQQRHSGPGLEVLVNGNYKVTLDSGKAPQEFDTQRYRESVTQFYQQRVGDIVRIFGEGKVDGKMMYCGIHFPGVFLLADVNSHITKNVGEGKERRKVRYVVHARFLVPEIPDCLDPQEALTQGVYLYCLRGFIAHHMAYCKQLGKPR